MLGFGKKDRMKKDVETREVAGIEKIPPELQAQIAKADAETERKAAQTAKGEQKPLRIDARAEAMEPIKEVDGKVLCPYCRYPKSEVQRTIGQVRYRKCYACRGNFKTIESVSA